MRRPCGTPLRALIAAAAVVPGLLAGCGVGPRHTLDAASVEGQIASRLSSQYGAPNPSVLCPKAVPVAVGQEFTCDATIEGQSLTVDGTVTNGSGRFSVSLAATIIEVPHAVAVLQRDIAAQTHVATTVDCGRRTVLVVEAGSHFSCTATQAGVDRAVTVTVVNQQGDVRYSLAPPSSGPGSTTPPATAPAGTLPAG